MINVTNLSHRYGNLLAVDQVSFQIGRGEIVGLLGHNGAGKSTIMKMLTGFLEPSAGEIRIAGEELVTDRSRAAAGINAISLAKSGFATTGKKKAVKTLQKRALRRSALSRSVSGIYVPGRVQASCRTPLGLLVMGRCRDAAQAPFESRLEAAVAGTAAGQGLPLGPLPALRQMRLVDQRPAPGDEVGLAPADDALCRPIAADASDHHERTADLLPDRRRRIPRQCRDDQGHTAVADLAEVCRGVAMSFQGRVKKKVAPFPLTPLPQIVPP